jgi:hypothetical protein
MGRILTMDFGLNLFEIGRQKETRQVLLLEEQISGFQHDMEYKAAKTLSENSAMLAQADQPTPEWMVDSIKILIEMMTRGKLNIKVESGETQVSYLPGGDEYNIGLNN